jgi:hypothetical protein
MAPKRLFIDLTNDLDDTANKKRRVIDNEQFNHHNIPGEKGVLRGTARKLAHDVTCGEVLGDNTINLPCRDSSKSLDKLKPGFVCFGSVTIL